MELTKDKKIRNVLSTLICTVDGMGVVEKFNNAGKFSGSVPETKQYRTWRDVRRRLPQGVDLCVICQLWILKDRRPHWTHWK